jgi:hypothetical protein
LEKSGDQTANGFRSSLWFGGSIGPPFSTEGLRRAPTMPAHPVRIFLDRKGGQAFFHQPSAPEALLCHHVRRNMHIVECSCWLG